MNPRAHPDFDPNPLPRSATMQGFDLTPLSPAEVEEDFAAVTGSAHVLRGLFGDWPNGLTLEENLYDMGWHDREFLEGRSFAWIVRDKAGGYTGCAYLYPEMGRRGAANGYVWVVDRPERLALQATVIDEMTPWLNGLVAQPVTVTWHQPPG
ncbi:hypothetical protein KZZ07_15355 [Mameliella sp. CS4]|uniref:hypothetical protein n=1 Tax=Mameliella sp. CS4 TaxID=2862329 RepID=UPI001C5FBEC6|nr:hypothetical protein [Mameliella sp. CS4]MBW4983920.1 hypothetical protein [Mameliella sp. CS4]